jgi:hypothetical protein
MGVMEVVAADRQPAAMKIHDGRDHECPNRRVPVGLTKEIT